MDEIQKQNISDLVCQLTCMSKDSRNDIQSIFINEFSKNNVDWEKIQEVSINSALYHGLDLGPMDLIDVKVEEWVEFKKSPDLNLLNSFEEEVELNSNGLNKNIDLESPEINENYFIVTYVEEENDIKIHLKNPKESVPIEVFKFITEVRKVKSTIIELFKSKPENIKEHLLSLTGIARVGSSPTFSQLANMHLKQLKDEIVFRRGYEMKFSYLKWLGVWAILIISLCGLAYYLIMSLQLLSENTNGQVYSIHALIMIMGSCVGAWLSFAIRKKEIAFEDLRLLNEDVKNPLMLLLIVILISLCFYLMFITNFLNVKVGNIFDTSKFIDTSENKRVALLIGIFFGLSENSIGPKLTSRADFFMKKT